MTKSPWAKRITVIGEVRRKDMGKAGPTGVAMPRQDTSGPGDDGQVSRPGNRGMSNPDDWGPRGGIRPTQRKAFRCVVRWESAQAIRDAGHTALATAFAGHYVVGVTGVAVGDIVGVSGMPKLSSAAMESIRSASSLTVKGKIAVQARVVRVLPSGALLGFLKESIPLTAAYKEVEFATTLNRMAISMVFHLPEMTCRGALAI